MKFYIVNTITGEIVAEHSTEAAETFALALSCAFGKCYTCIRVAE